METILFSKTDKIKIVTFVAVAFGLPWLLLPQIRVEGILAYKNPSCIVIDQQVLKAEFPAGGTFILFTVSMAAENGPDPS